MQHSGIPAMAEMYLADRIAHWVSATKISVYKGGEGPADLAASVEPGPTSSRTSIAFGKKQGELAAAGGGISGSSRAGFPVVSVEVATDMLSQKKFRDAIDAGDPLAGEHPGSPPPAIFENGSLPDGPVKTAAAFAAGCPVSRGWRRWIAQTSTTTRRMSFPNGRSGSCSGSFFPSNVRLDIVSCGHGGRAGVQVVGHVTLH
jgi:hypothetical protein